MDKKVKQYKDFVKENVETAPLVKPTTTPTPTRRKSPFRKNKPSVSPRPKASVEDVANRFLELTKDNKDILSMLKNKYGK